MGGWTVLTGTCEACDIDFRYESYNNRKKALCPECTIARKKAKEKEWREANPDKLTGYAAKRVKGPELKQQSERRASKKPKKNKKNMSDLARINAEAREHGMSYGEYVPYMKRKVGQ